MATIKRKPFSFRADSDILESAKVVFKQQNISVTKALNLFLEKAVEDPEATKDFLEVDDPSERIFKNLQTEIAEGYADYRAGKVRSLEEAREVAKTWN